jgi:hypothetical protein
MQSNHVLLARLAVLSSVCLMASWAPAQIQATLLAPQPLVLQNSGGTQSVQPAGSLTSAALAIGPASLGCSLAPSANGWLLESDQNCPLASSGYYLADTELLVSFSSPTPVVCTLRLENQLGGDAGAYTTVDVGDDGVLEYAELWGSSALLTTRDHLVVTVGPTPLSVRITQQCGGWPISESHLDLALEPWSPLGTPAAAGAGGVFSYGSFPPPQIRSDHLLDLIDDGVPGSSGLLRARGLGQFEVFVASLQPNTLPLQLPAPFAQTCDVLANVGAVAPGTVVAGGWLSDSSWDLRLPQLPAGVTFYVQHLCAKLPTQSYPGNTLFDASNVVRIDT